MAQKLTIKNQSTRIDYLPLDELVTNGTLKYTSSSKIAKSVNWNFGICIASVSRMAKGDTCNLALILGEDATITPLIFYIERQTDDYRIVFTIGDKGLLNTYFSSLGLSSSKAYLFQFEQRANGKAYLYIYEDETSKLITTKSTTPNSYHASSDFPLVFFQNPQITQNDKCYIRYIQTPYETGETAVTFYPHCDPSTNKAVFINSPGTLIKNASTGSFSVPTGYNSAVERLPKITENITHIFDEGIEITPAYSIGSVGYFFVKHDHSVMVDEIFDYDVKYDGYGYGFSVAEDGRSGNFYGFDDLLQNSSEIWETERNQTDRDTIYNHSPLPPDYAIQSPSIDVNGDKILITFTLMDEYFGVTESNSVDVYVYPVQEYNFITDRTQADVDEVKTIKAKFKVVDSVGTAILIKNLPDSKYFVFDGTQAEYDEYMAGMKGAFNATDFNRIYNSAQQLYLALVCRGNIAKPSSFTYSEVDYDYANSPTTSVFTKLTTWLNAIRSAMIALGYSVPSVPSSFSNLTYQRLNNIETVLETAYNYL